MDNKHLQQGLVVHFGNNIHIFMTQLLPSNLKSLQMILSLFHCWVRAARERAAHEADVAGRGLVGCENEGRVGAGGLVAGCTGLSGGRVAV